VLDGREGVSAVRDGLIHTSPCDGIDLPKMKRRKVTVYPITAVDTLMTRLDEWWEIMVLVMADTGMRWGEVQGLEVRDFTGSAFNVERTVVELTKKVLTELGIGQGQFYVKDYPKDGEDRLVTLSPEVAVRVEQVIKHRELFPGDRIFGMHDRHGKLLRTEAWPTGRPVVRSHFRTVWRAAHGDDIPILKVHALRGSMISWLVLGGTDLGAVMTRAGHSRLATTQGYFDQFSDADQRALAGLARARAVARGTV
jgi:integrase